MDNRYNRELENMFGDLELVSFIRIKRLKWIGNVNGIDADRVPKSIFNKINQREIDSEVDLRILYGPASSPETTPVDFYLYGHLKKIR